ncbi:Pimeloyl-ACP methyl ester carboxylesterase [Jatrophihabitans endophyticus]|uniref:Pimeloyl-ACP methyl ester carboxylesterase n=1 Tax=Jatrophihabitans endophyticus TaxID=1206085 RepID=A0A1M5I5W9_9ACTN|nr:alpha/beta hydrolase [Jatrophihabitans endophyticus]SHG23320.1 Pimeloyl-ACP methyl ester carboxylesterase [Jatrophihabitans endophyticus]
MVDLESRQAIADLSEALLACRPMIERLDAPVRVATGGVATGGAADPLPVANRVAAALGLPQLAAAGDGDGDDDGDGVFHGVVSDRIALGGLAAALARIPADSDAVAAQAARCAAADLASWCERVAVPVDGGAEVTAWVAGDPDAPAVVLSSACGMPARLAEPWLRHLAVGRRVVLWESRGMFGDLDGFRGDTDVDAQVADARAVLAALDLHGVHLVGLCGGAVVAARCAAAEPERVSSLSLWHGDFDLGDAAPKTDHQRNLLGLMDMAVAAPDQAESMHEVVCQSMLGTVPADLAPLVLYPYLTAELFLRYCRLNSAIMHCDLTATLRDIAQPTLVVTSATDDTAHPQGSREVARRLAAATLVVNESGDHISLFRGDPGMLATLDEFLARTVVGAGR